MVGRIWEEVEGTEEGRVDQNILYACMKIFNGKNKKIKRWVTSEG